MVDAVNSGGLETTRMSAEEKEERQRREKQVDARGNLAAMMCEEQTGVGPLPGGLARPVKERIERGAVQAVKADRQLQRSARERWLFLLEAMGLDIAPSGRPGYCRREGCNQPLPMSAASPLVSSSSPHWKRGYCSPKCWTED
jgi:hypothetical protein